MYALPLAQTFIVASGIPALGQKRTHAPQQIASLFDHLVVMHFALPAVLCDFFAQVGQPNTCAVVRNQILLFVLARTSAFSHGKRTNSAGYSRSWSDPFATAVNVPIGKITLTLYS
jgi:hypothetical protein